MSPYRTVNYLAYRVSVSTSAARAYAQEARALADEASELDIGGGPDHHDLLVPEIQAQAARAGAAATRAEPESAASTRPSSSRIAAESPGVSSFRPRIAAPVYSKTVRYAQLTVSSLNTVDKRSAAHDTGQ